MFVNKTIQFIVNNTCPLTIKRTMFQNYRENSKHILRLGSLLELRGAVGDATKFQDSFCFHSSALKPPCSEPRNSAWTCQPNSWLFHSPGGRFLYILLPLLTFSFYCMSHEFKFFSQFGRLNGTALYACMPSCSLFHGMNCASVTGCKACTALEDLLHICVSEVVSASRKQQGTIFLAELWFI